MPRNVKSIPSFLKKRLDPDKLRLVQNNFEPWLRECRAEHKGEPPMNMERVHEFITFLGDRQRAFRHIPEASLKTT